MTPGGRDLESFAGERVAPNIGQFGWDRSGPGRTADHGRIGPGRRTLERSHHLSEVRDASDVAVGDERGMRIVLGRHHAGDRSECADERHGAEYRAHRTIEAHLPQKRESFQCSSREHTACGQDADGYGEVETGSHLGHAGRREIDDDAGRGPGMVARQHRGANTVARLATRRVGQADDRVAGKAVGHVDLDGDPTSIDATERGGTNCGKHGAECGT